MDWLRRHRLRWFLQTALWPIPAAGMVLAVIVAPCLRALDALTGWTVDVSLDGAIVVGSTMAGALLSMLVFILSMLLLVLQLASAQLTPRVISHVFRDPRIRLCLGLLTFLFTLTLLTIVRLRAPVPLISGWVCGYGGLVAILLFLVLVNRFSRGLRPVIVLGNVAVFGRKVVDAVYPDPFVPARAPRPAPVAPAAPAAPAASAPTPRLTLTQSSPGILLAFDEEGLVELASRTGCEIEIAPQVGAFVAAGDPLLHVRGSGDIPDAALLRRSLAFGLERTMEQDPAFVFRIIVDVALKALSPAINDPTTAVLALDQLHHLLRQVGNKDLQTGVVRDGAGRILLLYRTPDWEDFVALACTEIRHAGAHSIQVVRRLCAMLENLRTSLPKERHPELLSELELLRRTVERSFADPVDRRRAGIADSMGVGSGCAPGS